MSKLGSSNEREVKKADWETQTKDPPGSSDDGHIYDILRVHVLNSEGKMGKQEL